MSPRGYTAVAILLHWAIAVALLGNLTIGWWMHHAIEEAGSEARAIAAFQLHKSIGLTVLVLSLLRLAWRFTHPPPAPPAGMTPWEQAAARATHWFFYGLMIAIPLSGWLYVSTQWRGGTPFNVPTIWFGLFEVPHFPGLNEAMPGTRRKLAGIALGMHAWLAWATMALLVGHVVAALKHHFVDRDEVLGRMVPLVAAGDGTPRTSKDRGRRTTLGAGFAVIGIAAAAVVVVLVQAPGAAVPPRVAVPAVAGEGGGIDSRPGAWAVDPERSEITFAGVHAGTPFEGRFTRWQADIRLDAENVSDWTVAATVRTASATDGVSLHERTLPQDEWFDVAEHPVAEYRATSIRPAGGHRYEIAGILTIKERDVPVPRLTLRIDGDTATITGTFTIDRADADLGMESDPAGTWVSRAIEVGVRATVMRES